ncbi:RICIN domain-containing protein [Streptomyces sp. NPDC001744]|uniref:RICIN domain-containing protein n=1 Tax=Streptomyces sp. NPDC001744 TaxID=3364606 RepID=UPI00367CD721
MVRRAVTMRGTAEEPGSEALRPRTAEAGAAAPGEETGSSGGAGTHGEETPTVVVPVSPSVPEPASSGAASTTSGATSATAGAATAGAEAVTASSEARTTPSGEPAAAAKRDDDAGEGEAGSLTATGSGSPPGVSAGDTGGGGDEPPPGRPAKALLAAAGIGGALLIAVPFLVMGTGRDDRTEPAGMAQQASARTLQKDEEPVRPGNYAPKAPETTVPSTRTGAPAQKKDAPSPTASAPAPEPVRPAGGTPGKGAEAAQKRGDGRKEEPERKEEPKKEAPAKQEDAAKKTPPPAPPNYSDMKRVLLRNMSTKMCADVPDFGKGRINGPVNQFYCNGTDRDNQLWDFEVRYKGKGPKSSDLFQIVNRKDGLCMDLGEFGARPRGTRISQFYCNGTTDDNQLWWLEPRGGKSFWIRNYASNHQCLEVVSGAGLKTVDARLDIQPCHGGDDFEWTLW